MENEWRSWAIRSGLKLVSGSGRFNLILEARKQVQEHGPGRRDRLVAVEQRANN